MAEVLAHPYLEWLEGQIANNREPWAYHELFERMHRKEFVWIVPNDDNRVADGLDLRREFYHSNDAQMEGCSFLEMLIALSRRMAFAAGGEAEDWAWRLICNLGLDKMSGHIGKKRADEIDEILETVIWRTYLPDGQGGFFPLSYPSTDQRKVELWYQMSAYINEYQEERGG